MDIDYKEYEDKVRKVDGDHMRRILKKYVAMYSGRHRVLDIACGKGDFLSLAKDAGINAIGIDDDPSIVKDARSRGLEIQKCNAFNFLETNTEPFDGIFCSQFIEHLSPNDLMRLLALIHRNLTDDGLVILTTPNSRSLVVHLQSFYRDFSHVRFYDLELIEFMMECANFKVIDSGLDPDTAFQVPLMPIRDLENDIVLKSGAVTAPNIVPLLPGNEADEMRDIMDKNNSGSNTGRANSAALDHLKPKRQKGFVNGIKYRLDLIVFWIISRYLYEVYYDIEKSNKALTERDDLLTEYQRRLSENQTRLLENQGQLLSQQSQLIETSQHAFSSILKSVRKDEESYNSFINGIYGPHDVYVKGIKRVNGR